MATTLHENPAPGVMKFTIMADPSLVIITIQLVYMDYARNIEEDFIRNI